MSEKMEKPLTEEELKSYFMEGYVVAKGLVPEASIDDVLAHADVSEDALGSGQWSPIIFRHEAPADKAHVHRLLMEPSVVAAVEQIFEVPARVHYGMLAVVPANGGSGLPWHQDNQYTLILGSALNVFIALCDITPDKAILWVAPGSHRLGCLPAEKRDDLGGHREASAPENGVPLPAMKKGDVCIFDRNTLHRSLKNETDEHRYAYAAQYRADYSRDAETGDKDARCMQTEELARIMEPILKAD